MENNTSTSVATPVELSQAKISVESDAGPLLQATPSPFTGMGKQLPSRITNTLVDLLQLEESCKELTEQTYRVVLSPDLAKGLRDGTFSMARSREIADGLRLNVVDANGLIVGQGTNVPVDKALDFLTSSFQMVTFVAGQRQLAQITEKLVQIETLLKAVKGKLDDMQEGNLRGKMKYLQAVAKHLGTKPLNEAEVITYNSELETIERETLEVAEAIELELERHEQKIRALRLDGIFTFVEEDKATLLRRRADLNQSIRLYEMAQWVRLAAVQLKYCLPVSHEGLQVRIEGIKTDLVKLGKRDSSSLDLLHKAVNKLGGRLVGADYEKRLRREVREQLHKDREERNKSRKRLIQQAEELFQMMLLEREGDGKEVAVELTYTREGRVEGRTLK